MLTYVKHRKLQDFILSQNTPPISYFEYETFISIISNQPGKLLKMLLSFVF